MKVLYFDCFSGASGDMILGALIDAGVAVDDIRRAIGSLAIDPDTIMAERVVRAGISATKFNVRYEGPTLAHAHDGHHPSPEAIGPADSPMPVIASPRERAARLFFSDRRLVTQDGHDVAFYTDVLKNKNDLDVGQVLRIP